VAVNWAQVLFNSAVTGSLYLIGAVGLTLTYGLSGFPNFAHAEFIALGALAVTDLWLWLIFAAVALSLAARFLAMNTKAILDMDYTMAYSVH
jgi:branched-subunit amino acid ABC-type transport system permease component